MHKTVERWIDIGVADSSLAGSSIYSDTPYAIYYNGSGQVWGDGKGKIWEGGKKLQNGDTASVTVDLGKGEVEWVINGTRQFKYSMARLTDDKIKWVPYL